jgi:hypothetical protein
MARRLMIIALILMLIATPCLAMSEEEYRSLLLEAKEIIEGYQALLKEKDETINTLLEINAAKDIIIEDLQKQLKPKFGFAVGTELSVKDVPKLILMVTYSW